MNQELLKTKIDESGYKRSYIAENLGISNRAFENKVYGKTYFKSIEMSKLAKILNLTEKEYIDIFLPSVFGENKQEGLK